MWDLIVSVPDHCLSFYFEVFNVCCGQRSILMPDANVKHLKYVVECYYYTF